MHLPCSHPDSFGGPWEVDGLRAANLVPGDFYREARLNRYIFVLLLLLAGRIGTSAQEVRVFMTSRDGDRLAARPHLRFEDTQSPQTAFHIDSSTRLQRMDGFGASFLEAGMICLNSLDGGAQENVLRSLFDPKIGAGFTAMKTPLAGTDFMSAGPWYTYDDTPGDTAMAHFSIDRDLGPAGLVTYIKRARRYGSFKLQAPMDYPPDWMLFDVNSHQDINPQYYDALAQYYLHYVRAYAAQGIVVDYVSLFNEPLNYTKIPYGSICDLLKNHVGPLFTRERVRTRLQLSEAVNRRDALKYYPTVLDDPAARKFVANLAYHGYDRGAFDKLAELHRRYPAFQLWMTEVCHAYEAGYRSPQPPLPRSDYEDGDHWGNVIFSDVEAGASAWLYWNMILDEHGGPWLVSPIHGNPDPNIQHPVVIINRANKTVTYTALYYYLSHFSRFVRPGSVRVATTGGVSGVRCIAFERPDGGMVAEVLNSGTSPTTVTLGWKKRALKLELPALSISTYLWNGR